MDIKNKLTTLIQKALEEQYGTQINQVEFQPTRKDFPGDMTVLVFPFLKHIKGNPVQIGTFLGNYIKDNCDDIEDFNVVSGFLNLEFSLNYFLESFYGIWQQDHYGIQKPQADSDTILVEYSSPNTNKPLHLGHIRNNLLGYSVAEILKAAGNNVYKTQIINDRGIHICKSMLAYQKFGNNETPESSGLKGDKLIGNYYVAFDKAYREEIKTLMAEGHTEDDAKKNAPILLEAQAMLKRWESGDPETVKLWETMNQWVYDGFDITYKNLGVNFDKNYYESNTYLLGKDMVKDGLDKGVFFTKDDGSVWIDLSDEGLDEKIVLRADGTAVYMTQDIGTAIQRKTDYPAMTGMVYTVGNEQDYHFKVLFLILKKLGYTWAEKLYHLSYGMVDLPEGKMKSREGTVVDADDLMQEMADTAKEISKELGKLEGYSDAYKERLYSIIGLGALKYFILKIDPKKRILFDPKESIDFNGNTGPFIQYTYARIQSLLRKTDFNYASPVNISINDKEKEVIKLLENYPDIIQNAAQQHSPAVIANYIYDLVKAFNSFYQSTPILTAETADEKIFRIQLSKTVGNVIAGGFKLLGIEVPERM
ncbi:MAG: arginine--tRNA ligase [Flavobacteriia bacterium]|nr:MAG: arginine--tRNA ligase [Flavobacteriia bacterium]